MSGCVFGVVQEPQFQLNNCSGSNCFLLKVDIYCTPWYVQYAPEIVLAIFLASLGISMYLSPKFRKAVIDLLWRLID